MGESLEFEQSNAVDGRLPIIPKPLPGTSHEAEVSHGIVVNQRHTAEAVKSSPSYNRPNEPSHSKSLRAQGLTNLKSVPILSIMDWRL